MPVKILLIQQTQHRGAPCNIQQNDDAAAMNLKCSALGKPIVPPKDSRPIRRIEIGNIKRLLIFRMWNSIALPQGEKKVAGSKQAFEPQQRRKNVHLWPLLGLLSNPLLPVAALRLPRLPTDAPGQEF
jgi:hypothetical protein